MYKIGHSISNKNKNVMYIKSNISLVTFIFNILPLVSYEYGEGRFCEFGGDGQGPKEGN